MTDKFAVSIFGGLILRRGTQVLLMQRAKHKLHGGAWAFPGGSIDGNETVTAATVREAAEEIGVQLHPNNLKFVHVVHVKDETTDIEYINFFFEATLWTGEPQNMEPHKCSDVAWFDVDNLPHTCMPMHKQVLKMIKNGVVYSEFGF